MNPWINFLVVVGIQFLFFLFLAYKKRAYTSITLPIILKSVIAGVLFGVAFDLVIGKYLGIFTYALQFTIPFLLINGAFSYGLWFLTIQLLALDRLLPFFAWIIGIGFVYEVANYIFPVWHWTFGGGFLFQEALVIFVAYGGLALLTALTVSIFIRVRFRAFSE